MSPMHSLCKERSLSSKYRREDRRRAWLNLRFNPRPKSVKIIRMPKLSSQKVRGGIVGRDQRQWPTPSWTQVIRLARLKKKLRAHMAGMMWRESQCQCTHMLQVTPLSPLLTLQVPRREWCLSRNFVRRNKSRLKRNSLKSGRWKIQRLSAKNLVT